MIFFQCKIVFYFSQTQNAVYLRVAKPLVKTLLLAFINELKIDITLDPVVQSIVSLTSSLRGQLVKCFTTL